MEIINYLCRDIGNILTRRKETVGTIESCTCGMLASAFGNIPGASNYFAGGIVSYQTGIKKELLEIDSELLDKYGTISEFCAFEMALKGSQKLNTTYTLSVTGNAGPNSVENKETGLVYIALFHKNTKMVVYEYNFTGSRNEIRKQAVEQALILLNKYLEEEVDG